MSGPLNSLLMQLRPNEGATLPDAGASGLEYIADVWGDAVYEMMMENDIHVSLPAWKPEGFIMESVHDMRFDGSNTFMLTSVYRDPEGRYLQLSIRNVENVDMLVFWEGDLEADETLQEIIVFDEVNYFIMSNIQATSLTWIDGTASITLSGNLDNADIETIIKSIESGG